MGPGGAPAASQWQPPLGPGLSPPEELDAAPPVPPPPIPLELDDDVVLDDELAALEVDDVEELDELDDVDATHWFFTHVWSGPQPPQGTMPLQPSGTSPQSSPAGQAESGVQPQKPGKLGVPPPQVSGGVHVPQSTVPPQPSGRVPHFAVSPQSVAGVQPQTLGTKGVPPPQVSGAVQVPQSRVPPQPSGRGPQLAPAGQAVRGTQPGQISSCEGVDDCWQLPWEQVPAVAVHASQAPQRTLALDVSQTGVTPLHAPPSSPHEHMRQPVSVVPAQMGCPGPLLTHAFCLLLQSCCTVQLRPDTVMVAPEPLVSQMSPISPQPLSLSPQAAG